METKSQEKTPIRELSGDLFTVPDLPYAYGALEPYIDEATMKLHHDHHHKAYVEKLKAALVGTEYSSGSLESILSQVSKWPLAVRNNGGGHWNHSFFWKIMTDQKSDREIPASIETAIKKSFGSVDEFKTAFAKQGTDRFGSGWAWLIKLADGSLKLSSTPNQDNPLMDVAEVKGTPVLGCDLWEHAYYLRYNDKRAEYLKQFWNVVNWKEVERRFST